MRRRLLLSAGLSAAIWPAAALSQSAEGVLRVGVLMSTPESDSNAAERIRLVRQGLASQGWVEGSNLVLEVRWADADHGVGSSKAQELVLTRPAVLIGGSTLATAALQHVARDTPIIFAAVADPIGSGFVESFARPGGNITGFINFEASLPGKWLELLREIKPNLQKAAIMYNPDAAPGRGEYFVPPFEAAATSMSIEPVVTPILNPAHIVGRLEELVASGVGALILAPDAFTSTHRRIVFAEVSRHSLPTIYGWLWAVPEGGLMAYGVDSVSLYEMAGVYAGRVLNGGKPESLPVQAPTNLKLAINLKAADAGQIVIPMTLLAQADEVIE